MKRSKPFSIPQILMNHSQQAAYAKTSYYGNIFVSPHQYIFFITLIWLLSLIWSKKVESHEHWRVALTFSESRKQMSSFSECCIGLSVIFPHPPSPIHLCLLCGMVRWKCLRRSQVVWEFYPTNLWAFKGKDQKVREVPESSAGMFSSRVRRWSLYILMFCCLYCDISS